MQIRKWNVKREGGDKFRKIEGEWKEYIYIFIKEKVEGVGEAKERERRRQIRKNDSVKPFSHLNH